MKRYVFPLLVFLLFLAACDIEKPHLPTWDIDLDVPLINETYLLADMVDNENIYIADDNTLYLQNSGTLSTPSIGDIDLNTSVDVGPAPLPSGIEFEGAFSPHDLDQGYHISYGLIDSGSIKTRFTDVDPSVTSITITFDGIYTASGNPLVITRNNSNGWQTTSLANHHMGVKDSGLILDDIGFSVQAVSSQPQGEIVANLQLKIENGLQFSEFQGSLQNYNLNIDDNLEAVDIDYPYGIEEAIQLQTARMALTFQNQIGFGCEFIGELYGINDLTGASATIPIKDENGNNFHIDPALNGLPQTTELLIGSGIEPLLQIMPHHIEVRNGVFKLRDGIAGAVGTVHANDQITGSYTVDAPFRFVLLPHTFLLNEPQKLEISEDNRERIRKNAISAELDLLVRNMLPVGASATVYVDTDSIFAMADSTSYAFKRQVSLGSVSENPGFQEVQLSLNAEEMQIFTNPTLFFQLAFSFNSNGLPVTITASPSDYVQVKGMLKARVHIEEDK